MISRFFFVLGIIGKKIRIESLKFALLLCLLIPFFFFFDDRADRKENG